MSIPNLSQTFDRLGAEQLCVGGLDVELHPTQPLVLLQMGGTAVLLGLDPEGVLALVRALLTCHERLVERAASNGKAPA